MSKLTILEDKKPNIIAEELTNTIGITKVKLPTITTAILGIMAGSYIGLGSLLSSSVSFDVSNHFGIGIKKLIAGGSFTLGLILVIIAGAELFTGNNLIILSVLSKKNSWKKLLKNWVLVYFSNFLGAILISIMFIFSGLWKTGNNELGISSINIALSKINLSFHEAIIRAIGCNWMVCLAIWMALGSRNITGKIISIFFPIMGFVAIGFEHCIANMYFIPTGLFLKNLIITNTTEINLDYLTWYSFFIKNLIPVTIGNIIGGTIFVGLSYWYAYIKPNN